MVLAYHAMGDSGCQLPTKFRKIFLNSLERLTHTCQPLGVSWNLKLRVREQPERGPRCYRPDWSRKSTTAWSSAICKSCVTKWRATGWLAAPGCPALLA